MRILRPSFVLVFLSVFFLALPLDAWAQPQVPRGRAVIVGTVTDAETGDPLQDVNVFIAQSMTGTATDAQGRFRLANVPLGAQQLYISSIGYKKESRSLNLRESRVYTIDVALETEVIEGEGVVVEAERDEQWLRRFERFRDNFIGETPNAEETTILNREVLSFSGGMGTLEAFAAEPLQIENKALGYNLEYHLEDFKIMPGRVQYDGEPLFREMEGTPAQKQKWAEARREAFMGSFHHLMLAMLAEKTEAQGFKLYNRPQSTSNAVGSARPTMSGQRYPVETSDLMKKGDTPSERILDFQGFAEVIYLGEQQSEAYQRWRNQYASGGMIRGRAPRYQTSQFWLERGPATVDYKGDIVERYGVVVSGYYAFERVADQIPKEYRP